MNRVLVLLPLLAACSGGSEPSPTPDAAPPAPAAPPIAGMPTVTSSSPDTAHRWVVIGIDGMDPRVVDDLTARGQLPNLAKLCQEGVCTKTSSDWTIEPASWTTIATGVGPERHGVDRVVTETPSGRLPIGSTDRRAAALWDVASAQGYTTALAGWWASWPANHQATDAAIGAIAAAMQPDTNLVVLSDHETEVSTQNAKKVTAEQLTAYDAAVAEKAYGQEGQHAALEQVVRARTEARAGLLDLVRGWSVGMLFGEGDGTLAERGRRVAEPALATVFGGEGSVDMSLHKRVIPIVEEPEEQGAGGLRPRSVAESFVPDLIALAEANGARIVPVWLPYPAVSEQEEEVDPARLAELVRTINQAGAGWLDLHGLEYPPDCFMDRAHMNAKGRERFTPELARALTDLGAFREGPMIRAVEPFFVGYRARREGTPAPLAALSLGPFKPDPTRLEAALPDYDAWSNRGGRVAGVGPVSPLVVLEDGVPLAVDHWATRTPTRAPRAT